MMERVCRILCGTQSHTVHSAHMRPMKPMNNKPTSQPANLCCVCTLYVLCVFYLIISHSNMNRKYLNDRAFKFNNKPVNENLDYTRDIKYEETWKRRILSSHRLFLHIFMYIVHTYLIFIWIKTKIFNFIIKIQFRASNIDFETTRNAMNSWHSIH